MTPYQTLYRKYRSQTFSDLVGQEAVSRALQGAVIGGRVAHAYLFSGTRGTGKTSSARLLAKALNCSARGTGSAEPCNACESCLQITAGAALDLVEIDAASNRGIDEIRELRERVMLAPALGPRKIYIIDEAHMLTTEAFNALLKTLEEPPDHVVFILCTTEAQKVPATVLGRCQQFVFRRLNDEQISGRLQRIAASEGVRVEGPVLALAARAAEGSMRDAVGLLDQLVPLAGDGGVITLQAARETLGIADPGLVDTLIGLVLDGRPGEALGQLGSIYEAGAELRQVVRALMERCRDMLLEAVERRDGTARARLSAMLDTLLHLDGEVRRHAEPRFLVEATLVRLAVAETAVAPTAIARQEPAAPVPAAPPAPAPTAPVTATGEAALERAPDQDAAERWAAVLAELSPVQRASLREGRPELAGGRLTLTFKYGFHLDRAREKAGEVAPLVRARFGSGVEVEYRLAEAAAGPAAAVEAPRAPEEDPFVQAAVRKLEGRVTRVREVREMKP